MDLFILKSVNDVNEIQKCGFRGDFKYENIRSAPLGDELLLDHFTLS